jgi:hypothetical protein
MKAKKPTLEQVQPAVARLEARGRGEKCDLSTGQPRAEPQCERRLIAKD